MKVTKADVLSILAAPVVAFAFLAGMTAGGYLLDLLFKGVGL
jgi:hypothetical protein